MFKIINQFSIAHTTVGSFSQSEHADTAFPLPYTDKAISVLLEGSMVLVKVEQPLCQVLLDILL